jgi:Fungal Zn(2)-Cys(6) binuclear cluster domain
MSATSETSPADPSRSASVEEIQDTDQQSGPSITANAKPPEKTISCVSCRKRKLKCDRVKPKCGTCTRLRHECEFPERRRNQGSKRRNIKELEARLAQVETQLISESKQTATAQTASVPGAEIDWNAVGMDMNLDLDLDDDGLLDPSFDISQAALGFSASAPNIPTDFFGSYELIGLGLQEALPPQDMMDELHQIYFDKHHRTMPIMHKLRYYASLDRAPHMRPPICLRYAMWTVAASLSDKYLSFEDIFYERARRYLQDAEMKVRLSKYSLNSPLKSCRAMERLLFLYTMHRLGVSLPLMRLRRHSFHVHG